LSRAVSLGVSPNKATVWASLAQLYKTAADARRQKSSGAEDIIEELERAAATCLDKARTLNPHEGVAWIHTGEEILSKSVFGEDEGNSRVYYEKAAKAFDVATKCAFEDAEHARIADAKFSATAAVAVLSEDIHNTHRYENIAAAIRAARARTNDPVAHWSLAMVCERRGLIDMAKEAFENALDGVLNGDTSNLDFTFGYGESDECRNAITDACKEGLERLEKRRAMTSAAQNDLNDGACATYASLKRRLQNAIREDPSNVHARVHLAQLLLAREEDDDDETFLALNVVSEPRAPFLNNAGGKGDFREQSSVARSVAWSCIANSPAYVYPVKSDDIESDKTRSEVLFRRANRMAAIATVLNPGDARNQDVLQTCLNRLQLRPRASGRVSSFNLDDEKMLRDLSKMAESDPKSNAETIASARLALAAKLAQSEEKEKRKEAKKHATRVSQTNSKTELDEQEREINNIKISERLVRASECFLAGSEL
jgi:tetratricopeptide (TPR) repeat protein